MNKELSNKVNGYLANIGVSYVKLHNLHWNVTGAQFKAVHEYLETMYNSFAEVLDATAEILKMHEVTPLASMKEYLAAATIKELDSKDIDCKSALEVVLADLELLKEQAFGVREAADKAGCLAIVNMMEDDIAGYAKNIWFLKSMTK